MGLNIFKWIRRSVGAPVNMEITCKELFEAAQEFQVRELCFWTCVNMIANTLGRCEFRTFRGGVEIYDKEYYLWNYSPNANQNSTMFLHKLVAKLYQHNEALILETLPREGMSSLVVADSWEQSEDYPSRQNEYRNIQVGDYQYSYPMYENNVLHLRLNQKDVRPVINGLYQSYYRLVAAAMKNYSWSQGQHWKVHVSQMAQGADGWAENFAKMIEAQVKPFMESDGAILPEFDGYAYENIRDKAGNSASDTRDIRAMIDDIFDFTARGFLIPAVLVNGKVEGTADANGRFLTYCLDPLCDQLGEEITRKRYGFTGWKRGDFLRVDSSSILHFDLFANAANVEKLVGSGAFTINDIRKAANQPTIEESWADEHWMTKNIAAMGDVVKPLNSNN